MYGIIIKLHTRTIRCNKFDKTKSESNLIFYNSKEKKEKK